MLEEAAVLVIPLQEVEVSVGQIRIADGISAGVPMVVSRVNGTIDYISHERTGLLVDVGDSDELRFAIERLLADRAFALSLARNAQEHAKGDDFRAYLGRIWDWLEGR